MSDPFSEMTDSMNEVMSLGGDVTKLRAYYKDWAKTYDDSWFEKKTRRTRWIATATIGPSRSAEPRPASVAHSSRSALTILVATTRSDR